MRLRGVVLLAVLLVVPTVFAQAPADATANPLAPMQWIVGDWHATAAPPNGKPTQIDNHIYWSETRTAIFFLTRFNGEPHYSGMYAFDTDRKQIAFWYVDKDGNFTQGVARPDGKRLVQEFTVAGADGKKQTLRSFIDRNADDSGYHWQVLRGEEPKPLIELDYTRKK
jgi:hypothetical protein